MSSLYELTADVLGLELLLDNKELDQESVRILIDAHLRTVGNIEEKVDAYCSLIREIESRAVARSTEAGRLKGLSDRDQRKAESLKERLLVHLQERQADRMETARFRLTVAKNGGKAPLIVIGEWPEPDQIPERFVKVRRSVDMDLVREALEAGEEVPGYQLGDRGVHLRIG